MKKHYHHWSRLVLCLLSLAQVHLLYGQDNHLPLLSEEKTWIYRLHDSYATPNDSYYCYYIKGDTVVDGIDCKKLWTCMDVGKDVLHSVMYEKGGKVFQKELSGKGDEEWFLLFDFGLDEGDTFSNRWGDRMYVAGKDSVLISGKKCCRLHLGIQGEEFHENQFFWLEGIGSNDGIECRPVHLEFNHLWTEFQSCYDGSDRIYGGSYSKYFIWRYSLVRNWKVSGNTVYGAKDEIELYRADCMEPSITLNGKDYIPVRAYGDASGYPIGIREGNGRVYADLEAYKVHVGAQGGDKENLPYAVTDDGSEVVLYDYNMKVGDAYPSGITVEKTEYVRLKDMEPRRCLTLSNGMMIIEGLGCVNSPGLLLDYLNPPTENISDFGCLCGFSSTYGNDQSVYEPRWSFAPDAVETIQAASLTGRDDEVVYDLQGRRLSSPPRRGLYILGGKMRMAW